MIELRVNNGEDRCNIISILANAGYTVSIEERLIECNSYASDCFVIIHNVPEYPKYLSQSISNNEKTHIVKAGASSFNQL